MSPRSTPSLLLCTAALLLVGAGATATATASAQRRSGAVLDLAGRRASARAVRAHVVAGAEGALELVGVRELRAAARARHADVATLAGQRVVAERLGLEVLLGGEVEGRGRRARLSLWALDASGTELGTRDVATAGRAAVRAAARSLAEEAVAVLEAREAEQRERRVRAHREQAVARRQRAARASDGATATRGSLLDVDAGLGGGTRNAAIALAGGGERRYDGALHPELSLRAELRPLRSFSRALGGAIVRLEAAHAVGARSWSATDAEQEIETTAWRLGVAAGYLAELGPVELGPTLGWGMDVFDLGDNQVMPSASYQHVRLGAEARVQLLDGLIGLRVAGGWRVVLSAGDVVDAFGDRASVGGWDLSGGVTVRPIGGLRLGLELGFTRYSLAFDGSGDGASATDGADERLHGAIQVGWSLR